MNFKSRVTKKSHYSLGDNLTAPSSGIILPCVVEQSEEAENSWHHTHLT